MTMPSTQRPDASLSLLQRLVEDAMDPGYLEVDDHSDLRHMGWRSTALISVVLLLLGMLVVAAVLQVRAGAPSTSETRAELVRRIDTATGQLNEVNRQVDALSQQVQQQRAAALEGSVSDRALADQVSALEASVGGAEVSGPGVEVTLADGPPDPAGEGGPDLARVLDTDVQLVVNGLFASGARAVAVNGQRLTVLSPIRSAGEAVLVGFRPLTPPYVVRAVGDDSLASTFEASSAREELAGLEAAYGIGVDVRAEDELTVPARPDLTVRYAHEATGPRSSSNTQEGSP